MQNMDYLYKVADRFLIRGKVTNIEHINRGYINRTYKVETLDEDGRVCRYILQRVNTNVFPDIDALMENFKVSTEHLFSRLEMPGHHELGTVQILRMTRDGKPYFADDSGTWRMMTYFDHVYSLDIPENPEVFYYTGVSFGRFVKAMSSIDPTKIKEVIPNFHNTKSR